jgi:hypothetical protein
VDQSPEALGFWEHSLDGISWEEGIQEQDFSASDCAHGMNRFACVRTDTLSWSADGVIVEHEESLMDFKLNAITALKDRFVAVGRGGRRVISFDGQTWAEENFNGDSDTYNGIAADGQTLVAVGGINRFYLSHSLDGGENWTDIPFGNCEGNSLKSIVWNRGLFVAQGKSDCHHNMHRSVDGLSWEPVMELHPFDRYQLLGAHNGWFFGHKTELDGSVGVYRSEDGSDWSEVHSCPAGTQLRKMSAEKWEIP